jgi:cytidylate kinase
VAPLRQAEDSIVLDNSNLTIEEQFQFLLSHAKKTISSKQ